MFVRWWDSEAVSHQQFQHRWQVSDVSPTWRMVVHAALVGGAWEPVAAAVGGELPDEASSSCIIHVLLLSAATDVFHMWGFSRMQQRAEDSRLRTFITSDFNKLESALKRATVTSDLGIRKLPHEWPRSASVSKSLLFLQINGQRASWVQPGSFLMSPFVFLSWSKERYTDRDIINRTSKVWTKWYFRWGCSSKIHGHLLTRLDLLTRDCGRDKLKSLASLTLSCGKPLKQTCCAIN